MFKTIADVRAANRARGYHFFSASAMRFFNSKVESALYAGRYFITSERFRYDDPKAYCIREVLPNGEIETIGEVCQYRDIDYARDEVRRLVALPDRQYHVHLHGRERCAIGIYYHISDTFSAKTEAEFARKFNEKYEPSGQRVTTVALDDPGNLYRPFDIWAALLGKPGFTDESAEATA